MKILFFLILFIGSSSVLSNPTRLDSKKINYVVIDDTAEPFQINRQNSSQKGLITEIFTTLLDEVYKDKTYNQVSAPFLRALKIMREGHEFKWVSYGSPKWKKPQSAYLSKEPLFKINHQLITRKGFKYKSIKDLFGKRVVLINGFAYPGLTKYIKNKKIDVLIVNSHASALKALHIKRADAFPEIKIRAKYHMIQNKLNIKDFKFHHFSNYIKDYYFHMSFSKAMSPEIPKFDKALVKIRNEKKIRKIISKYLR
jgi:hypothetical protein